MAGTHPYSRRTTPAGCPPDLGNENFRIDAVTLAKMPCNHELRGPLECDECIGIASLFRSYAYSNTISIKELAHFGTPEQVTLPEDTGTGLIWRLSSITRLEERDGGVYAEVEALALSRDIPTAFRPFVTPIVRRVSRDSLATSLHQTRLAIDDQLPHHEQVHPAQ